MAFSAGSSSSILLRIMSEWMVIHGLGFLILHMHIVFFPFIFA